MMAILRKLLDLVFGRYIVVRLADMGCMQNLVPIALELKRRGVTVVLYLDIGSQAAKEYYKQPGEPSRFPEAARSIYVSERIPWRALVFSCLPDGNGFDLIEHQGNPVVLVQENPNPGDKRFPKWSALPNLQEIYVLVKTAKHDRLPAFSTGLPKVDQAANDIAVVNTPKLLRRLGLDEDQELVVVSLPKDKSGCKRMLDLVSGCLDGRAVIVRNHPALPEKDVEVVAVLVDALPNLVWDLKKANDDRQLTFSEFLALGIRAESVFLGEAETTAYWDMAAAAARQAVPAAGLYALTPEKGVEQWEQDSPVISLGYAAPFAGEFTLHSGAASLPTFDATKVITERALAL